MMRQLLRIGAVTVGLIVAGSLFGALAGATALSVLALTNGEWPSTELLEMGAFFGAPLGAVLAPLLSWMLLRRVPLGRMFVSCSLGTIVMAIVAWFIAPAGAESVSWMILGGAVGCLAAAIGLWRYAKRLQRA